ncbi:MAG TPA: hypothetical protein VHB70_02385 [Parafilimonas sp.]|nr:hypothetical protein [Parafilimonas sp.]
MSEYNPSVDSTGKIFGDFKDKEVAKYDKQGNLTEMQEFNDQNQVTITRKIVNDSNAKRSVAFDYDNKGRLISIDSFKYDEYGNRVEDLIYTTYDLLKKRAVSNYDDKGNMVSTCTYDMYNNYEVGYIFKMDSTGKRLETDNVDKHAKVTGISTYFYSDVDKEGNWRRCFTYYNGSLFMITILKIKYY